MINSNSSSDSSSSSNNNNNNNKAAPKHTYSGQGEKLSMLALDKVTGPST